VRALLKSSTKFLSLSFFLLPTFVSAQEEEIKEYRINPGIIVTASRIPTSFEHVNRTIEVIDKSQIEQLPASDIQELLETVAGVDIRQQGPQGVQADVSIRGATFEQTLILLDGVKINDPQTGHHNMNLPIDIKEIERIEVLKGPGSRLYGPNAFGGASNIITTKPEDKKSTSLQTHYGEDQTYDGVVSTSLPTGALKNRITVSAHGSDGYRPNTEFRNLNGSYRGDLSFGANNLRMNFGYTDKEFGANQFYGSTSELQWEETKTTFASSAFDFNNENMLVSPKVFWRRHKDHYIWNRERPSLYENFHTTNIYGLEMQMTTLFKFGEIAFGGELSREEITSNNLGEHGRSKAGLFLENKKEWLPKLNVSVGASAFYYSDWGWQVWPGFDAGFSLSPKQKVYLSYGQAFRVPTYTELFYTDPRNRGNSNLEAETNWSWELGYRFTGQRMKVDLAFFRRQNENLIDCVWTEPDSMWQAQNITELVTDGFEAGFRLFLSFAGLKSFRVNYTYLNSDKDVGSLTSKYTINHLKHQLVSTIDYDILPGTISQNWVVRYEDRLEFDNQLLLDTRLIWRFEQFSNILNETYQEFLLFQMPGRKFKMGLRYDLK